MLQHLVAICSRLLSLIILPAQLPGDVVDLIDDLARAPVSTVLSWPPKVVLGLARQFVRLEKLTIEQDTALEQMTSIRRRYLQRGWAPCPVRTSDGVLIDAVIKEPPPTADGATGGSTGPELAPRYIIFVGGNFQKYELWLSYYEVYARDVGCGFFAFNFRGVGHSEGAVTAAADLVTDVAACVDALLLRGVLPQHLVRRATAEPRTLSSARPHTRSPEARSQIATTSPLLRRLLTRFAPLPCTRRLVPQLLHGFSVGGAVSALYLASQAGTPNAAVCYASDRSLRTPHAHAHALELRSIDPHQMADRPTLLTSRDIGLPSAESATPTHVFGATTLAGAGSLSRTAYGMVRGPPLPSSDGSSTAASSGGASSGGGAPGAGAAGGGGGGGGGGDGGAAYFPAEVSRGGRVAALLLGWARAAAGAIVRRRFASLVWSSLDPSTTADQIRLPTALPPSAGPASPPSRAQSRRALRFALPHLLNAHICTCTCTCTPPPTTLNAHACTPPPHHARCGGAGGRRLVSFP